MRAVERHRERKKRKKTQLDPPGLAQNAITLIFFFFEEREATTTTIHASQASTWEQRPVAISKNYLVCANNHIQRMKNSSASQLSPNPFSKFCKYSLLLASSTNEIHLAVINKFHSFTHQLTD